MMTIFDALSTASAIAVNANPAAVFRMMRWEVAHLDYRTRRPPRPRDLQGREFIERLLLPALSLLRMVTGPCVNRETHETTYQSLMRASSDKSKWRQRFIVKHGYEDTQNEAQSYVRRQY